MASADFREQLQSTLGSAYALERELGGGGMARVFVATETALGRRVVVKVLPPDMAHALSAERFRREVHLAARLHHPHVLSLLAAGERDGLLYYTMPFVEGESLRAKLTREGELPVPEAVRLLREVTDALAYAHAQGVVHRDLKPDNVLLEHGHAAVADFGIAKALSVAAGGSASGGPLTSASLALGTPAYMAPEQVAADPAVDHRADLYALGCLAYELLAGAPPFAHRTPQQALAAHVSEAPEPIVRRRAGLPPALAALVMRLLEKRPADRPQSGDEVLRELDALRVSGSGATATAESARPPRHAVVIGLGAAALTLALSVAFVATRRDGAMQPPASASGRPPAGGAGKSVAVLPFANIGGDTAAEYFADGMTEELIAALAKVEGLRVPGRTSVFALKDKGLDPRTIGDTLRVDAVLEGSVRRAGGRLRVGARLVSAENNDVLWSETYDRELKDVFRVQDELARAIVGALRLQLKLTNREGTILVRAATTDLEAHDLYLQGRSVWNQRTFEALVTAAEFFTRAIERDSTYAQAYAGLADTYVLLPLYGPVRPGDAMPKAKSAATRALALDSTLAEAHTSLAFARMLGDYDWNGAETEFRRALALDPSYPTAHHWYAIFLRAVGQSDSALAEIERARALDPLSRMIGVDVGRTLASAHRYDEAVDQFQAMRELDPNFARTHVYLCSAYLVKHLTREALAECELGATLSRRNQGLGVLAYAYASAGDTVKAKNLLRELEARGRSEYVAPSEVALAHLGLGDTARAFQWLDSAVAMHDPSFTNVSMPLLDLLRADPRFGRLRARMRLP